MEQVFTTSTRKYVQEFALVELKWFLKDAWRIGRRIKAERPNYNDLLENENNPFEMNNISRIV